MHKLKAIIFDVDGTLAATEETHRQAFNIAFKQFNIPCQWSVFEYAELLRISGGKERILQFLGEKNITINGNKDLRNYVSKVHQYKSKIYREKLMAGHIGLRSGVERLINEAQCRGVRMAIATCSSIANVEVLLKRTLGGDALSYFKTLASCDLVIDKKPSPAVYQYALANLGLMPENCVAIEDTSNGNRAALVAGIKTVITTHPLTAHEDFTGASLVVDRLGEPRKHCTVSAGDALGADYVDIDLLAHIVATDSTKTSTEASSKLETLPALAVATN